VTDGMSNALDKKHNPGLLKRAFANQYNFILLGAAGLFALATFSWVPLVIGAGVETLWLVLGADSTPFRRWVLAQEKREAQEELERQAKAALAELGPGYIERFDALREMSEEIQKLGGKNRSLEARILEAEMAKLGRLLHGFLHMAVVHQRLGQFLEGDEVEDIERDIRTAENELRVEKNREVAAGLRQSLGLAQKRLQQHVRIHDMHRLLGVKMDTLEKSFAFLRSHILGVGTREELAQEIDDLIVGVESVESLSEETSGLLTDLERARAARAGKSGVRG
jgi:hypothetical protein